MRFKTSLAYSLLLCQVFVLTALPQARAQGLYGAGYNLPLPARRHRNDANRSDENRNDANRNESDSNDSRRSSNPDIIKEENFESSDRYQPSTPRRQSEHSDYPAPQETQAPPTSIKPSGKNDEPEKERDNLTIIRIQSTGEGKPERASISSDGALHDLDKTTEPWFADEEKLTKFKKVIEETKGKIQSDPNNVSARLNRSDAYLHLGKSQEAIEDADHVIQIHPSDNIQLSNAHCNRGEGLLQQKKYDEAMKELIKAISIDDENAEAIYFRGMARERLGQLEMAMKDYAIARDLGFAPKGVKVDYGPYMAELQRVIKKHWYPLKQNMSRKTVVYFHLYRNGTVSDVRVNSDTQESGVSNPAILAVTNSAPFDPLPKGAPRKVDVAFNFDFNVFDGHGLRNPEGNGAQNSTTNGGSQNTTNPNNANAATARKEAEDRSNVASAEKSGDEAALISALIKQGDTYRENSNYTGAEEAYRKAQKLLDKRGDNGIEKAKVIARLAKIDTLKNNKSEAESLYNQSLDIALQAGKPLSDPETGEILRDYAKLLYKDSRYDEVKKMYDKFKPN